MADHPDFAPAHGSLAEIYASAAFHDEEKGESRTRRFLALCPGARYCSRVPEALPEPSPWSIRRSTCWLRTAIPSRIAAMAQQGIRDDEWRLQRIRPFDWYSVDYKRQAQRDLQAKYWRCGASRFAAIAAPDSRKRPPSCSR